MTFEYWYFQSYTVLNLNLPQAKTSLKSLRN